MTRWRFASSAPELPLCACAGGRRRAAATIESVLPVLEPMLASTGAIAAPVEDWAFEPKLDGWRALVYVDGDVTV
jgi:ATP-dependent DNA ligase